MRWIRTVGVVTVLVATVASCGIEATFDERGDGGRAGSSTTVERSDSEQSGDAMTPSEDSYGSDPAAERGEADTSAPVSDDAASVLPPPPSPVPAPAPVTNAPAMPASSTSGAVQVIDVIDGDTIKIAGGQNVRLIGIDTPERGECGYTEAAFVLASMINGHQVVLVPGARTDADRYGRLLRYVEVDGKDLNLEMIRSGRAIARYDSRDGYGRHPRQDLYVSTDAATPSTNNCTAPPAAAAGAGSAGGGGGGTDPRFGTCKEAKAAGYGNYVRDVDPEYYWYRDGDRDGIACE